MISDMGIQVDEVAPDADSLLTSDSAITSGISDAINSSTSRGSATLTLVTFSSTIILPGANIVTLIDKFSVYLGFGNIIVVF